MTSQDSTGLRVHIEFDHIGLRPTTVFFGGRVVHYSTGNLLLARPRSWPAELRG